LEIDLMRTFAVAAAIAGCLLCLSSVTQAVEIRGQYLEARTCDVYTGPCFANGEMGMAGKEALLAWKVDEGGWNGTSLEGLTVALVVKADDTLGENAFPSRAGKIRSVILVDDEASEAQQLALVDFVKQSLPKLTSDVQQIERMPMSLENDHYSVSGVFKAGDVAEIRTRKLGEDDCVCTNEMVYYRPLAEVQSATPAYSERQSYAGEGLNSKWRLEGSRSSFLAVFRK
jgi:hypothetical protein